MSFARHGAHFRGTVPAFKREVLLFQQFVLGARAAVCCFSSTSMKTAPSSRFFLLALTLVLAACTSAPQPRKHAAGFARDRMAEGSFAPQMERPGLGTGWGEERDSHTAPTTFVRAHSTHPSATDRIFYNDREGVEAMLDFEGGSRRRVRGLESAAGGLISLGLRDGSGRWLDGFAAGGRRFVVGERGERYEIVVRNETGARVEVVLSVDGLDVMDGRRASFSKRGYIIGPHDALTVEGFRTSASTVAAFRFSSVSRSYAALRHGDTRNVGVIGAAVFEDRSFPAWHNPEGSRRREANPFPGGRWAQPPR